MSDFPLAKMSLVVVHLKPFSVTYHSRKLWLMDHVPSFRSRSLSLSLPSLHLSFFFPPLGNHVTRNHYRKMRNEREIDWGVSSPQISENREYLRRRCCQESANITLQRLVSSRTLDSVARPSMMSLVVCDVRREKGLSSSLFWSRQRTTMTRRYIHLTSLR